MSQVHIPENFIMTCRTDLTGRIIEISQDFSTLSGFSKEEIIGKPNNFLRHSDVPDMLVNDLWRTLSQGKSWHGPIKNITKQGDYYWVQTNVSPVYEDGEITGYASVRRPLSDKEVVQAEVDYERLRSGKLTVENGCFQQQGNVFFQLVRGYRNISITKRVMIVFVFVFLTYAGSSLYLEQNLSKIEYSTLRIADLRVPTVEAARNLALYINASQAALRGWVLTKDEKYKANLENTWLNLLQATERMDQLSQAWREPEVKADWGRFKGVLSQFEISQQKAKRFSYDLEGQPAAAIFVKNVKPLAEKMIQNHENIMLLQYKKMPSKERMNLSMALDEFNRAFKLSLTSVHAAILTGEINFIDQFYNLSITNSNTLITVNKLKSFMTDEQRVLFASMEQSYVQFKRLAEQMFEIRLGDKWDMARYTLVSEAAPQADELLRILFGATDDEHVHEGIVALQRKALNAEVELSSQSIQKLLFSNILLLAFILVVSILLVLVIVRFIVRPVKKLQQTLIKVRDNSDFSERVDVNSKDEIGEMGHAFNGMMMEVQYAVATTNETLQAIADGEYRSRDSSGFKGDLARLESGLAVTVEKLKANHKELEDLAYFDPLTKLPNRTGFQDRLQHLLEVSKRHHRKFALLFIDLDNFKFINDTHGHHMGDEVLKAIAERLIMTVRSYDHVSHIDCDDIVAKDKEDLARLGGDEFTVIVEIEELSEVSHVAQRIIDALCQPIEHQSLSLVTAPSIGIAVYPQDGETQEMLVKHADAAMYLAKSNGKKSYQFFNQSINEDAHRRMQIEVDLHSAIHNNELHLVYQPQQCLLTHEFTGFEALLRWDSPRFGSVSPSEFIPIAEESHLIVSIGKWVIEQAFRQVSAWSEKGYAFGHMGINLSLAQFADPGFITFVRNALGTAQIDPAIIDLEVTERILLDDPDHMIAILHELKALGVMISIDDFGTGYSSMAYLKQMPIDQIKIDKAFVDEVASDAQDQAIIVAIRAMCESMGMTTIAEGVEDEFQYEMLNKLMVTNMQGFYFSKPLSVEDAEAFYEKQRAKRSQ